jgi:hypothetical protein
MHGDLFREGLSVSAFVDYHDAVWTRVRLIESVDLACGDPLLGGRFLPIPILESARRRLAARPGPRLCKVTGHLVGPRA